MAAVSQFAGDSLLHQGAGFEPQRKSNFALVIYGVGDTDTLVLSIEDTSVPGVQITQGSIKYFNETMRYAGSVQPFDDQTIHYRDYIDRNTLDILSGWMDQVVNFRTGGIGWAKDYKRTADVFLLPPSMPNPGAPGAVFSSAYKNRKWHLEGVWPKSLKTDDLDMKDDGTTPSHVTMALSVDRCHPVSMNP